MKESSSSETRRAFDYQERWHGWGSPVGLGVFLVSAAGAVFLFFAGTALLLAEVGATP